MTSSENLASLEAWTFRPSFTDTWITDAFARDTDVLTKALQKSLSKDSDTISSFLYPIKPEPTPTPSSGSDPETAPKPSRNNQNPIPTSGKISKRKSRASKRSPTTFITADPSNFRQMVQQVTGIRFSNPHATVASPVLKPEPQRVVNRLPTLDTSAFLLDHHHQVVGPVHHPQQAQFAYEPAGFSEGTGLDFESFPSFPTLESWRVM
ncbi:calmodulin-binding protein 25-like [Tasmannia lanceolata]|uniref:calmodulin-binding protein 25-like n=1 Tax=Tasmannia lanceolata TaxID=3420 RepID=UPI0040637BAA